MKIIPALKGKCPRCETGNIFSSKGNSLTFRMPVMHKTCPECNFKFEKETGFFFGAMFVSYALAVAEMLAVLVLSWQIFGLTPLTMFLIIIAMAFLFSTFNFRLSRTIWIYMFYKD